MKIKTIIFGASGMVGQGVVKECLDHPEVEKVLAIVRKETGLQHEKYEEIIHQNFFDYAAIEEKLKGYNACYFCLGVSAVGMSEEKYTKFTYDLTLAAANKLASINKDMTFVYVSGTGTDSTEKSRSMWARVKGKTENAILALPFKAAYMFRPGYIQPMKGVKSKTGWYQFMYNVFGFLYPLLKILFPNFVTSSDRLGMAMINVTLKGSNIKHFENKNINQLANLKI